MMVDFYSAFGDDADVDKELPKEIIEALNKELPSNLFYLLGDDGSYHVVPKENGETKEVHLKMNFDLDSEKNSELLQKLQFIPKHNWPLYLFRTQKSVAIKDVMIGDDEQLIPFERTLSQPLSDDSVILEDFRMQPEGFPEPIPMEFKDDKGNQIIIHFQQQIYDSITEIKYSNIDFPALNIEIFIYNPIADTKELDAKTSVENPFFVKYSVTPTKASTASEAVLALHIFKGLFTGKTLVNGHVMVSSSAQAQFDNQRLDDALEFWPSLVKLEDILGVQFVPSAEFPMEDVEFFHELNMCFIDKQKVIWKQPFTHFHYNGNQPKGKGASIEDVIGKAGLLFQYIEGPIPCTLLGTEFEIFSLTEMDNLVITNIEWDDEAKKSGEIYIADVPGKIWELRRLYMTKEKAEKARMEIREKDAPITP